MMWKDSYRLGVERIDNQHMELFHMTENLVNAVENGASVEVYQEILGFLKDYVIYHFKDEEAYQASIHYSGLEDHRKEHQQFTQTVLNYEKLLTENGFNNKTMKDLAGVVTTWLIYHVTDSDQKIVSQEENPSREKFFDRYVDLFSSSVLDVMWTMAALDPGNAQVCVSSPSELQGELFVKIQLMGDLKGDAVFGFSKGLALNLLQSMTGMELTELDELVQSALCELTNISCGNAATALTQRGLCCDISTPVVCQDFVCQVDGASVHINTDSGCLSISILGELPQ